MDYVDAGVAIANAILTKNFDDHVNQEFEDIERGLAELIANTQRIIQIIAQLPEKIDETDRQHLVNTVLSTRLTLEEIYKKKDSMGNESFATIDNQASALRTGRNALYGWNGGWPSWYAIYMAATYLGLLYVMRSWVKGQSAEQKKSNDSSRLAAIDEGIDNLTDFLAPNAPLVQLHANYRRTRLDIEARLTPFVDQSVGLCWYDIGGNSHELSWFVFGGSLEGGFFVKGGGWTHGDDYRTPTSITMQFPGYGMETTAAGDDFHDTSRRKFEQIWGAIAAERANWQVARAGENFCDDHVIGITAAIVALKRLLIHSAASGALAEATQQLAAFKTLKHADKA
ncbi:hypothetical protein Q4S45_21495 [Massilia sp. R2A-15]|uniref:hypothetical protein n=1 Tax=Massilia sp. R2A-15 TaxID=3064278 RepID=UPI0027357764|nr:hypothetical protein [Massilia sp. R2A-15]WLI89239.1 hypothetical protein Q4S45_21495 [Massilia sp. R2A-15]